MTPAPVSVALNALRRIAISTLSRNTKSPANSFSGSLTPVFQSRRSLANQIKRGRLARAGIGEARRCAGCAASRVSSSQCSPGRITERGFLQHVVGRPNRRSPAQGEGSTGPIVHKRTDLDRGHLLEG